MANENPGQGSSSKGIFNTPFGNAVSGKDPVGSGGVPKSYDYGNATDGFDKPKYDEKGCGIISGPGCATGKG